MQTVRQLYAPNCCVSLSTSHRSMISNLFMLAEMLFNFPFQHVEWIENITQLVTMFIFTSCTLWRSEKEQVISTKLMKDFAQ